MAFHRGWMVPEVIAGVKELLDEHEKLPKCALCCFCGRPRF